MEKEDMKGGKVMEKFEETRTTFGEICPYCNQVIKGNSESAARYNLGIHIDKHSRKGHNLPKIKQ